MRSHTGRKFLIFCDGTCIDGNLTNGKPRPNDVDVIFNNLERTNAASPSETPVGGGSNTRFATNVLRLSRSVIPRPEGQKEQIVFYQSGVGSEADFKGDPLTGTTATQMFGIAVARSVMHMPFLLRISMTEMKFLLTRVDRFSRGAYAARKLSGLIDRIGLLQRGLFFRIWRQLVNGEALTIPEGTRRPTIKCVGVWDTVGSVLQTIDALSIKDNSLPTTVEIALHALSLHENRKMFFPMLWTETRGGLHSNQILKQVWFPGAHSDVGGGYERHELADIALYWMVGEIKDFVILDLEFLRASRQQKPDAWGTSQPHNAYWELSLPMRLAMGHSIQYRGIPPATSLKHPEDMIALDILKGKFGPSFLPPYSQLNSFEAYCKDNWDKVGGSRPPPFENPGELFGSPVYWTAGKVGLLPPNAIKGGHESSGSLIYVARAFYEGGIHPGKAKQNIAYVSYDKKEVMIYENFERLVGDEISVRWAGVSGKLSYEQLYGATLVRGGEEADGTPLFIARASLHGGVHCGKIWLESHARIPYDGKEREVTGSYSVLVYV